MYLPEKIQALVGDASYTCDSIGKSGAAVLCYPEAVLKIAPYEEKFEKSVEMLRWLQGRLPVPQVLCAMTEGGMQYLLMSRIRPRRDSICSGTGSPSGAVTAREIFSNATPSDRASRAAFPRKKGKKTHKRVTPASSRRCRQSLPSVIPVNLIENRIRFIGISF
jgi:hypothetical protein